MTTLSGFQQHIFLVEDDERLAELTKEYLENHGFKVSHETRGDQAVERILSAVPDLVILDLMLPGLNGLEVFKQLQSVYVGPVLMLTAKDEDFDQILGLELGADDYVVKPVHPRMLLARITALLRRYQKSSLYPNLSMGNFSINVESREVTLDALPVDLTTNEFNLLWYLASHAGQVMSRDEILLAVRGIDYDGLDRWVDVCISRLRSKLKDDKDTPVKIKTVWGKGYLFVKDAWD